MLKLFCGSPRRVLVINHILAMDTCQLSKKKKKGKKKNVRAFCFGEVTYNCANARTISTDNLLLYLRKQGNLSSMQLL